MSLLDLDKARADYAEWVTGTDDPPTLDEEAARLLMHRITGHHFPNLLAAHLSLRSRVEALADELDQRSDETAATYRASGDRAFFGDSITRREIAQRLRRSLSDNKEQQ